MIPGFASAERAWENATPYDTGCDCDPLYVCQRCDEYAEAGGPCKECEDKDYDPEAGPGYCAEIDREDCDYNAKASCPRHGWCTGCSRPTCEDCGGDGYDRD